jgi:pyruvate formate lyase activating enzyme
MFTLSDNFIVLRKTSLVDYPGKISAVLFFPGCNLRCPWCHNPDLVQGNVEDGVPLDEALAFLEKRKNILEAVVLSGGEATLFNGLPELISSIKKLNLLVKLDTNGTQNEMLERLFQKDETKPDYIALDIKIPPNRYGELANHQSKNDVASSLKKSAALISRYNIKHEFRTLVLPNNYLNEHDIDAMASLVDDAPWIFRAFVSGSCLDETWNDYPSILFDEHHPVVQKAKMLEKNVVVYR